MASEADITMSGLAHIMVGYPWSTVGVDVAVCPERSPGAPFSGLLAARMQLHDNEHLQSLGSLTRSVLAEQRAAEMQS